MFNKFEYHDGNWTKDRQVKSELRVVNRRIEAGVPGDLVYAGIEFADEVAALVSCDSFRDDAVKL